MVFSVDSTTSYKYLGDLVQKFLDNPLSEYVKEIKGVSGIPVPRGFDEDPFLSVILLVCFILVILSLKSSSKMLNYLLKDIFTTKERGSFNLVSNLGFIRFKLTLLLQTFILEGTVIYIIFASYLPQRPENIYTPLIIGGSAIACFLFYLVQLIIFKILGYVFDRPGQAIWINSFPSITAMRGVILYLPVLIVVFDVLSIKSFIIVTFLIYLFTRLIFIYKGLKIFLTGFYSLMYLILYLCTLEIAPLFLIYKGLFLMFSFVELKLF